MYGLDELTTSSTVTSHYLNLHPQELILAHLYHPHESHYQSSKRNSQDTFTYKPPSSPFCSVYSFSYSFSSQQDSFCSHWLPVTYTMSSSKQMSLLLMTILSSFLYLSVSSFEYEIGANEGWVVPPANDTRIYNDWASENRFQVDDTIRKFTHKEMKFTFSFNFLGVHHHFLCRFQVQEGLRHGGQCRGLQEVQLQSPQLLLQHWQHCLPS